MKKCLWLIDNLHRSATHAASPDRATGYGIPQTVELLKLLEQ